MPRPVTLFTGQWADMPIAGLAAKGGEWGFDGLELASWGDHFDVARALGEGGYCAERRQLLESHGLGCWAISNHLVGQAVCDPIDARHEASSSPSNPHSPHIAARSAIGTSAHWPVNRVTGRGMTADPSIRWSA